MAVIGRQLIHIKEWTFFFPILSDVVDEKEEEMKTFQCGTLVPGCEWETSAEDEAEIVRRAVEHLKSAHGEETVRENMVENIKKRIKDSRAAA